MRNLVPEAAGSTPSYWCTWGVQNFGFGAETVDPRIFHAAEGFRLAMDALTADALWGEHGWANDAFAAVRGDLLLLLDVGWDLPLGVNYPAELWRFGAMVPHASRFPDLSGSPVERLAQLNAQVQAAGWRGLGLWVSPQVSGDGYGENFAPPDETTHFWRTVAQRSREAGINYWKADIGARSHDLDFRRQMTEIAHAFAPDLAIEHARLSGPLNDEWMPDDPAIATHSGRYRDWDHGRISAQARAMLAWSDIIRTYDVTGQLGVATTLDRVAALLDHETSTHNTQQILNCEDEVYLGAALGCALGVMRHPSWKESPLYNYDPQQSRQRIDAVTRAVRWQRLAPAFAASVTPLVTSHHLLTDRWHFQEGEVWAPWYWDHEIAQAAPAVVARGVTLPQVRPCADEAPFVVAMCHPNGAHAVATLPRTRRGQISTPPAAVTLRVNARHAPIGIFGTYDSLTLISDAISKHARIWAQDLAGTQAEDITAGVISAEGSLIIPGALINTVGLAAATPGDLSAPGLVLTWEGAS